MSGINIREMVLREDPPSIFTIWTAMDYLRATGRAGGPTDGKCEVCHVEYEGSWVLMNYLDWHCNTCAEKVSRARFDALIAAGATIS